MDGTYEAQSRVTVIRGARRQDGTPLQGDELQIVLHGVRMEYDDRGMRLRPPEGWVLVDVGDNHADLVEGVSAMNVGQLRHALALLDARLRVVLDAGQVISECWARPYHDGEALFLRAGADSRWEVVDMRRDTAGVPADALVIVLTYTGSRVRVYHSVSGVHVADGTLVITRNKVLTDADPHPAMSSWRAP